VAAQYLDLSITSQTSRAAMTKTIGPQFTVLV